MSGLLAVSDLAHNGGELLQPCDEVHPAHLRQVFGGESKVVECVVQGISDLGHAAQSTAGLEGGCTA